MKTIQETTVLYEAFFRGEDIEYLSKESNWEL